MNGPEHYAEAERLTAVYRDAITAAEQMPNDTGLQAEERAIAISNAHSLLTKAQVHATLASAAAAAGQWVWPLADGETAKEWRELLRVPRPGEQLAATS